MKLLTTILTIFGCFLVLIGFYGCEEKESEVVEQFVLRNFRNKLFKVEFMNNNQGCVVGDHGLILLTHDGGKTWEETDSGTNKSLRSVSFIDENRGWAVGGSGTVIHTEDGGRTWSPQESGTKDDLVSVEFIDPQKGFVGGAFAIFLITRDGGKTWEPSSSLSEEEEEIILPEDIDLEEKMKLLAEQMAGEEEYEETMEVLNPLINDIFFVDANHGWIACEAGIIWHTNNCGKNWVKQKSGTAEDLFSIHFRDPNEGWATGLNGTLLHTLDGGLNWKSLDSSAKQSLFGIALIGSSGYALGNAGTIIKSLDGGETWEEFIIPGIEIYSWMRDIVSIDGKFVAVGGLGTILISEDGGKNWIQIT